MKLSALVIFSATAVVSTLAQSQFLVPVPWLISGLSIYNIRHGTGGFWNLNITDTPTASPQGFSTSCAFQSNNYYFAVDSPPYNEPCNNPNVTFGLFPDGNQFKLNITHVYECKKPDDTVCGSVTTTKHCVDNGTWTFSWDDVRGQESDVQNNFGQAGSFTHASFQMYPTREVASPKPEFS